MKVAVLADIHANLPALKAVLADMSIQFCNRIYHAGDLIAIGPYPAEVVDLARNNGMICVQGNHDQLITTGIPPEPTANMADGEFMHQHWTHSRLNLERRNFIRGFPIKVEEVIEGIKLTIVHFALSAAGNTFMRLDPRAGIEGILDAFSNTPGELVCFGHIHTRPINQQFNGRHFLNPGVVGVNNDGTAEYAVIEIIGGSFRIELRKVKYDRELLLRRYDELEIPARDFIRKTFFGILDRNQ
jgi:putative phosphoesterase